MKDSQSYYDILNVSPKASDEDIKHAYRILAKECHPDKNLQNRRLAELRFRALNEAYAALKTRQNRIDYNRELRQQLEAENDNKTAGGFFSQIGEIFWPSHTNARAKEEQ